MTRKRLIGAESRLPYYDPSAWSDTGDTQYDNNCYNYACNIRGTYAQPGAASGSVYRSIDCAEVSKAAISDGLVPIDCDKRCKAKKGCHQVALVLLPGKSFHWYRRDRDGLWSHKPGDGLPTNLDYSGAVINDPRTADRGPYSIFCGCFCACERLVKIR